MVTHLKQLDRMATHQCARPAVMVLVVVARGLANPSAMMLTMLLEGCMLASAISDAKQKEKEKPSPLIHLSHQDGLHLNHAS